MNHPESYLYPNWQAPGNIGAVFTTRYGGVSQKPFNSNNLAMHVDDSPMNVEANRTGLIGDQQLDSVFWLDQVHGTDVVEANSSNVSMVATGSHGQVTTADASFTRSINLACAVMVADCMPVMVTDRAGTCVGIAHAGWRGLCAGVVTNLIVEMGIAPQDVLIWLGPCIGPSAFEVGPDVLDAFETSASFSNMDVHSAFEKGNDNRYFCDLAQLAKMQLASMGVSDIYSSGHCTYKQSERYFSYRRDGSTGRMAALIWIKSH